MKGLGVTNLKIIHPKLFDPVVKLYQSVFGDQKNAKLCSIEFRNGKFRIFSYKFSSDREKFHLKKVKVMLNLSKDVCNFSTWRNLVLCKIRLSETTVASFPTPTPRESLLVAKDDRNKKGDG